jgi:hypothetical protein
MSGECDERPLKKLAQLDRPTALAYPKIEQDDLSADQVKLLRKALEL